MYVYEDCYMNTIDDMQNGKDFYDHYSEFEYNHVFLWKIWIKVMFYKQHILIYLYHLCSDNTVRKYTDDHIV